MEFVTVSEARTWFENSGYNDMEFGPRIDRDKLIRYLWTMCVDATSDPDRYVKAFIAYHLEGGRQ